MRKSALILLSVLLVAGIFRLGTMDPAVHLAMHEEMPDCPMGFVCPAQFESAQLLGSISTPTSLGLLIACVAVFSAASSFIPHRRYARPLLIFTDSGPPALRSVFKKE